MSAPTHKTNSSKPSILTGLQIQIEPCQRVSLRTVRLLGILCSLTNATQSVHLGSHNLQMIRITAESVATKMVELPQAVWRLAYKQLICNAVSIRDYLGVKTKPAIPMCGRALPEPAIARFQNINFGPKTCTTNSIYCGHSLWLHSSIVTDMGLTGN